MLIALELARLEIRTLVRGGLLRPAFFLQPLVLLFVIGISLVAPRFENRRAEGKPTVVAIEATAAADSGAAAELLDRVRGLARPELAFLPQTDPAAAVAAGTTDIGIQARPAGLSVLVLESRAESRVGVGRLRRAIAITREQQAGVPAADLTVGTRSLTTTAEGGRIALARFVPFYLLIQLAGAAATAASAIRGDKATRQIEALLVAPVPRSALVVGKALGALFEGTARLFVILGIGALAAAAPTGSVRLSLPAVVLAQVSVAGVALLVTFVGVGTIIGAAARSAGQESAGIAIVTFAALGAGLAMQFLRAETVSAAVFAIPTVGPAFVARAALLGNMAATQLATTAVGGVVAGLILVAVAARLLERDGLSLRDS